MLEDILQNYEVKKEVPLGHGEREPNREGAGSPRMQAEDHLDGSRGPGDNSRRSVTQQMLDVFEYFKRSAEFGDNK